MHLLRRGPCLLHQAAVHRAAHGLGRLRGDAGVAHQYLRFGFRFGIGQVQAQHEAVQLRLRQRIRSLELAGVLGRDDDEISRQFEQRPVHRYLPLLHGLEQRGLRARTGAVDLVKQHHIGEQGSGAEHEFAFCRVEKMGAGNVGRHQIGGTLDALELTSERSSQRLAEQGLAQPRHTLHQHMAAGDHRDTQCPDGGAEPQHHLADALLKSGFEVL